MPPPPLKMERAASSDPAQPQKTASRQRFILYGAPGAALLEASRFFRHRADRRVDILALSGTAAFEMMAVSDSGGALVSMLFTACLFYASHSCHVAMAARQRQEDIMSRQQHAHRAPRYRHVARCRCYQEGNQSTTAQYGRFAFERPRGRSASVTAAAVNVRGAQ